MCNRYLRAVALGEVRSQFAELRIPLRFPEGLPNLEPTDICITDIGTIIRRTTDEPGAELVQRRWSWPGPTGKPVFNYRSDGRQFPSGRCLIPASGFYEYTTPEGAEGGPNKAPKDRWFFTEAGEDWLCIAGIWRKDEKVGEAFTMLTTEPGPDVAPYHKRQVVVLDRKDWARWLDPAVPSTDLLRPSPAGTLTVRRG